MTVTIGRRELLAALGGAAAGWPLAASAQQAERVWRIGWIWIGRSAGISPELAGFRQGLKDFGYIEGQNVIVEYRFAEGRRDRIADLVSELVQMRPDVLVGLGNPVITALKECNYSHSYRFHDGRPGCRWLRCKRGPTGRQHDRRVDDARDRRADRQTHRTS